MALRLASSTYLSVEFPMSLYYGAIQRVHVSSRRLTDRTEEKLDRESAVGSNPQPDTISRVNLRLLPTVVSLVFYLLRKDDGLATFPTILDGYSLRFRKIHRQLTITNISE